MKCPYCGAKVVLKDATYIYHTKESRSYGYVWVCSNFPKCDSYVGCHKGTQIPLGRVANKELRKYKSEAHKVFDRFWKSGLVSRKEAYVWLADMLHIKEEDCHIGMFDIDMCKQVISICNKQSLEPVKRARDKTKKRKKY